MDGEIRAGVLAAAIVFHAACAGSGTPPRGHTDDEANGTENTCSQVLRFPRDQAVGEIYIQDGDLVVPETVRGFHPGRVHAEAQWLALAQGDVRIPLDKRASIWLKGRGATRERCRTALESLGPNDLYGIGLNSSQIEDGLMPLVARLTGLRELTLHGSRVTARGLSLLARLPNLERFSTPPGATDAWMAEVAEFQSLKMLSIGPNRIGDKGLRSLGKLKSLEVLSLEGNPSMTDDGLRVLRNLPSLRHVRLRKEGPFTDRGMEHLAAMPALKVLWLDTPDVTDEGLRLLAKSRSLERLCVHWLEKITDRGVVYLKEMSQLKGLDVNHARLTDAALAHIASMPNIDHLVLPNFGLSDVGIAHLSGLKRLKYFWSSCAGNSPLTNEALATLSQMSGLKEVYIGGSGFTNKGIGLLANLENLDVLHLVWPEVDDDTLRQLAKLKGLRKLSWGPYSNVSMSGLSVLNGLAMLEAIDAHRVRQDNGGLNISDLEHLQKLRISMCVQAKVGDGYMRRYDAFRDSDLACLSGLTDLEWLGLVGPGIGDDGIRYLAPLTNLEMLYLGGSLNLTDAGLKYLADMHQLERLDIYNSRITARGLSHLHHLKALRSIRISSIMPVAGPAIARLRRELPRLHTLDLSPPKWIGQTRRQR